jgi:hypothetical protein
MPSSNSICDHGEFFTKCNVITFRAISKPIARFVLSGPKFYSKPFYSPRTKADNFITFTSLSPLDVVFFFFL